MIHKAAAMAIKSSLRDMVDAWSDKLGDMKEGKEATRTLMTPAIERQPVTIGSADQLTRRFEFDTPSATLNCQGPPIAPSEVDLTNDIEEVDERDVGIVLNDLKEEAMLQNLLHKRTLDRNQ